MDLSIVTTLYQSASHLEEFHRRVCAVANRITSDYEIIFVNDGSPDSSLDIALSIYQSHSRVKVIDLSRNFGHHKAMMTGLSHAQGELILLIDSDLEEEPEMLERFCEELKATAADVVFGVQDRRKGKIFERLSGAMFFKLFNALSPHPLLPNIITARLMTRKYVSALVRHEEREMMIGGLWALTGFKQIPIVVNKHQRTDSTYDLRRKIAMFVDAITSFSSKPLVFIFYLGCFISLLSSIAALDLIIRRIFFGRLLQGWASLIVSVWLLGGLTLFCLGVIGIYLSKIFIETKQRPYTIIKEIYERRGGTPWSEPSGIYNRRAEQSAPNREA
jgi:putative glycosyltransferase